MITHDASRLYMPTMYLLFIVFNQFFQWNTNIFLNLRPSTPRLTLPSDSRSTHSPIPSNGYFKSSLLFSRSHCSVFISIISCSPSGTLKKKPKWWPVSEDEQSVPLLITALALTPISFHTPHPGLQSPISTFLLIWPLVKTPTGLPPSYESQRTEGNKQTKNRTAKIQSVCCLPGKTFLWLAYGPEVPVWMFVSLLVCGHLEVSDGTWRCCIASAGESVRQIFGSKSMNNGLWLFCSFILLHFPNFQIWTCVFQIQDKLK